MKKIIIIILLLLTVINLYSQPARVFNEKVIFTNVPRFNGSNTTNNSLKSLIIDKDGNLLNLPYTTSNNTITQQQVVQEEDEVDFPLIGQNNVIYVASHSLSTNNVTYYIWNGSTYTTTIQPNTGLTGIGLTNKVSKFSSPNSLSSSQISDDGTSVGINTLSSLAKFNIKGLGTTISSKNTIFMDSSNRELMSISNNGSLVVSNKSTDDSSTITASINTDLGGTGLNFVGLANGIRTFIVDRSGNITANNINSRDIYSSGSFFVFGGNGLVCTNTGNVNSTNTFLGTINDKWESNVKLKYATDLSSSYDNRTLVDKGYVDTVLVNSGIMPTLEQVTTIGATTTNLVSLKGGLETENTVTGNFNVTKNQGLYDSFNFVSDNSSNADNGTITQNSENGFRVDNFKSVNNVTSVSFITNSSANVSIANVHDAGGIKEISGIIVNDTGVKLRAEISNNNVIIDSNDLKVTPTATESTKGFRIQSSSTGDFSIEKRIDYNSFNFYSDGGSGGFGTSLLKSNPEEGFSAQFTGLGNENYNVTANTTGITLNSSIGGVGNELTVTPTLVAINGNEVVTINQLSTGKITVTDIFEQVFTDLNSANAWLTLYTNATITNESYSNHVYKFTVPANSDFSLNGDFCGISSSEVQFEDPLGLVTIFGNSAFKSNTQNNILGNVTFGTGCFRNAIPSIKNTINQIVNCNIEFALGYSGRIDVNLFGTDGTANLPTDMFISNNLIWINTKYSNKFLNGGLDIDLDLRNIGDNFSISTNHNSVINYEGIEKEVNLNGYELLSNKQTDLTSSSTGYPTVDAVNTGLATKQNVLVSGTNLKTINGATLLGSTNIVAGDAFTSGNITQFASNTSAEIASKVTNETGGGSLVFNNNPTFVTSITTPSIIISGGVGNDVYLTGTGEPNFFGGAVRASTISVLNLANSTVLTTDRHDVAIGKLQGQINAKQNTLVSGTDIKTINSTTVLGSGNLALFYKGNFSTTATAQTTFTVSIGATMANTTYRVPQPGAQNALSAVWYFVTNKTTTTFDIVTMSALSGVVSYDWVIYP